MLNLASVTVSVFSKNFPTHDSLHVYLFERSHRT